MKCAILTAAAPTLRSARARSTPPFTWHRIFSFWSAAAKTHSAMPTSNFEWRTTLPRAGFTAKRSDDVADSIPKGKDHADTNSVCQHAIRLDIQTAVLHNDTTPHHF